MPVLHVALRCLAVRGLCGYLLFGLGCAVCLVV